MVASRQHSCTDKTPYREYFGVLPDGTFYYGGKVQEGMRKVDQLVEVFKKRVTTNQVRGCVGDR